MEFESYPPLFIEDGKICGILDIPLLRTGYVPLAVVRVSSEVLYPPMLNFLKDTSDLHRSMLVKTLILRPDEFRDMYHIFYMDLNKIPSISEDTDLYLTYQNLFHGLLKFYNDIFVMGVWEPIDTQAKHNLVFNDISVESIVKVKLLLHLGEQAYPIPYKFSGLIDDVFFVTPIDKLFHKFNDYVFSKDHRFVSFPTPMIEFKNVENTSMVLFIDTNSQNIDDIKAHAKRFYTEHGF